MQRSWKTASPFRASSLATGIERGRRDCVLTAPGRVAADGGPARQPRDVGGKGQHFFRRRGRAVRVLAARVPPSSSAPVAFSLRRKQSTMRSVEAVEAARSAVVLGEHRGDAHERQRPLPLSAVQMAVVAGHPARREVRRLGRRVGEEPEAPSDVSRQARVVQALVGQRVLREIPRRHHGRAGRDERAHQRHAGRCRRHGLCGCSRTRRSAPAEKADGDKGRKGDRRKRASARHGRSEV